MNAVLYDLIEVSIRVWWRLVLVGRWLRVWAIQRLAGGNISILHNCTVNDKEIKIYNGCHGVIISHVHIKFSPLSQDHPDNRTAISIIQEPTQ